MNGNLVRIEKELRRVAKHSKTIKYTRGLLFAFLMMGVTAFSAEVTLKDSDISKTKSSINTSVKSINDQFREARSINKKLLKNANLELVQLMEQGDQVVKSPWSSWQFGTEVLYGSMTDEIKGRGDKPGYEAAGFYGILNRDPWWIAGISKNNSKYSTLTPKSDVNSATSAYRDGIIKNGYVKLNISDKPLTDIDLSEQISVKTIIKQVGQMSVNTPNISPLVITPPQAVTVTPNIIATLKQPVKPNLNPQISLNPAINPVFNVLTPTGINFDFSAGHNAGAPLRLGGYNTDYENRANNVSSMGYVRNFALSNTFHFVNWQQSELYFSQATNINISATNASPGTSLGRFFSENGGSSKILANYGKISIVSGSSDAFIFGDTVDDVYGGFPTAFSTSVYNSGTMTINADSRNGQGSIPGSVGMAYLSNGDDSGSGAKKRYLVNGINGLMEINGWGNYGILMNQVDSDSGSFDEKLSNVNRNILMNKGKVVVNVTNRPSDKTEGNVAIAAFTNNSLTTGNDSSFILNNNTGVVESQTGNNVLLRHFGTGDLFNKGVLLIKSTETIGMDRSNWLFNNTSLNPGSTSIGINDGVIIADESSQNIKAINGTVNSVMNGGTANTTKKILVSNGDSYHLGTDYDGNGSSTDSITKDIAKGKLGTGGSVTGAPGVSPLAPGMTPGTTNLDSDSTLNTIKENDQTNFSINIDGVAKNYTTSDGVIFLGGKNVVGLTGSVSGATSFSDLMEIRNETDGKIFIYTQNNSASEYSIGMSGNYTKLTNNGGIYLGIIPGTTVISDTVSGFTGINSNTDSSKNLNFIGMYGIGTKLENYSIISDRPTNTLTNNSEKGIGMYGKKSNSSGSILNNGTINIGLEGIGILGEGVSTSDRMSVTNTGLITANSGTGIIGKWAVIDQSNNNILLQGSNAAGIFAEGSNLKIGNTEIKDETTTGSKNSYGIALRENSLGTTTLDMNDLVSVKLMGTDNIGVYGDKISYTDNTTSTANRLGIDLGGNGIGVYLIDIQNSANIRTKDINTAGTTSSTGISGGIFATSTTGNIDIETNDITIGSSAVSSPVAGETFGVYVDAPATNTGKIKTANIYVNQENATGIYGNNISNIEAGNILSGKNGVYQVNGSSTVGSLKTGLITLTGTSSDMLGIATGKVTATGTTGYVNADILGLKTQYTAGNSFVGIYIPNGSLKIGNSGLSIKGGDSSTGVYVKDSRITLGTAPTSVVDFGTTSSSIELGNNKSVGIFLENQKVSNMMSGTVKIGDSGTTSGTTNTGIYTENVLFDNVITTNVETGKEALGLYLGADTNASSGNLTYNGNVTLGEGSTGIYKVGGTLERAATSTMTIGGANPSSIGFYLDDAVLNLTGSLNNTTMSMASGIAFLLKGNTSNILYNGTLVTEADLKNLTGLGADVERVVYSEGNQLLTEDITLSSNFRTRGHRAINGRIDLNANVFTDSLNPVTNTYGILVDGVYTGAVVSPAVEAYLHAGKTIDMTNSTGSIGIQALNGARIQNDGEIRVGASTSTSTGIGMYGENIAGALTSINNTGNIIITADKGTGIVTKNMELGGTVTNSGSIKNLSSQVGTIGIYSVINPLFTPTSVGTGTVTNSGTIELGEDSRGIYANNVKISNTGSIKVGDSRNDTAVGIYADKYSEISNSGNMQVGNNGIGYYLDNSKLSITGGNFDISNLGILVYGLNSSAIDYLSSTGTSSSSASSLSLAKPVFYLDNSTLNFGTANPLFTINNNSIGVYANNSSIIGSSSYELGQNSVGIYSNNPTTTVKNDVASTITSIAGSSPNAKGIVVKNGNVENAGLIALTGDKAVGVYLEGNGSNTVINTGKVIMNGDEAIGIYSTGVSSLINNGGEVKVGNSSSLSTPSIGIYTDAASITSTNGKIESGNNSLGIYSTNPSANISIVGNQFKVGENGIGIYTNGGQLTLDNTSSFDIANNSALGVYSKNATTLSSANMNIGANSFGYLLETGTLTTNGTGTLENGSVYIYSTQGGSITNTGNLTSINPNGEQTVGIYTTNGETVVNTGNIDLSNGYSNMGIYTNNGTLSNTGRIDVGGGKYIYDPTIGQTRFYNGVGIAAMNSTLQNGSSTSATIGEIYVHGSGSIGIYTSGAGTNATNYSNVYLDTSGATAANPITQMVGIFADNRSVLTNYGDVIGGPYNPNAKGLVGLAITGGATLVNYGNVTIDSDSGIGAYINGGIIKNYGTIRVTGQDAAGVKYKNATDTSGTAITGASAGSVIGGTIIASGTNSNALVEMTANTNKQLDGLEITTDGRIFRNGVEVTVSPDGVVTTLENSNISNVGISNIGLYVDTLGRTKPLDMEGVTSLPSGNNTLLFGVEAAEKTNSKEIIVKDEILDRFSQYLTGFSSFTPDSASLTWLLQPVLDSSGNIARIVMAKRDYTTFAIPGDTNTYNFTDGLEQRYGVEGIGTREKELFNRLNSIQNGEEALLSQAFEQMEGHEYANTQQRIKNADDLLDNGIDGLFNWNTKTKKSNKVKLIGTESEYNTDTAGVVNYKDKSLGIVYLNENESIKLGDTWGIYGGLLYDEAKFDDIGESKEEGMTGQLGIFKSTSFDVNNSLNWTVALEGEFGQRKMNRKYLVVDEIFGAKSDFYTYGAEIKNKVSKSIRLSEGLSVVPSASLDLGYKTFSNISENSGEMKLEVKADDYFSAKPALNLDLVYKAKLGRTLNLTGTAGLTFEYELANGSGVTNQAKVKNTTADYYDLAKDEFTRSSGVAKVGIGIDNNVFGITLDGEYNTQGSDTKGTLGFRLIF